MPLLVVSPPLPLPKAFFQPRPICSMGAASGSGPTSFGVAGAVALAEGMAAGDQGDGFLVVHGHAAEGLAHVAAGGDRVGARRWGPRG
jgi:hypothetical protein